MCPAACVFSLPHCSVHMYAYIKTCCTAHVLEHNEPGARGAQTKRIVRNEVCADGRSCSAVGLLCVASAVSARMRLCSLQSVCGWKRCGDEGVRREKPGGSAVVTVCCVSEWSLCVVATVCTWPAIAHAYRLLPELVVYMWNHE
jgi:hypothetical protein